MVPDYQSLMRPLLEIAAVGETHIGDAVEQLAERIDLSDLEKAEMLPSGRQSRFDNRVRWAKTYLKQAGLIAYSKRGHFVITERGRHALKDGEDIDNAYLRKFDDFRHFQARTNAAVAASAPESVVAEGAATPHEIMRKAYEEINESLAAELLDKVRGSSPSFFEGLIVDLWIAMGYGGTSEEAGRALGKSGDGGVDGVVDQDPLGVDQIFIQAKRYSDGHNIAPSDIREFFGALNIKRAQKGIFFTTSAFSQEAKNTAAALGSRIVLIDGPHLARLMIRHGVGCREEDTLTIKKIDEEFFDQA